MSLFCPIIRAHLSDCISLPALVQNFIITYILISTLLYMLFKNVKIEKTNIFYDFRIAFLYNKFELFIYDILLIGIIFSLTFMIHRYIDANFKENNNVDEFIIFFIILNIISPTVIICLNLLLDKTEKFNNLILRGNIILKLFLYLVLINIIAFITYSIMLLGYSNILLPPTYLFAFLKLFSGF